MNIDIKVMLNQNKELLVNTPKVYSSSKDRIDNVQSFVSCYLFILIFFCIIVAYDYRIFPHIEESNGFLKEGPSLEKILITEEEKDTIRAKRKYQKIIAKFVPQENITMPYDFMAKLINLSSIQKLQFNFLDVFYQQSLYPKHDFQKIIQDLALMQNNAKKNNDQIMINITCKITNSTDIEHNNYKRILHLLNQFLQSRINTDNWTFSIVDSDHDIITIDIFLN